LGPTAKGGEGLADLGGDVCLGVDEAGAEPGEEADEIVGYEDLTVAGGAGAYADGGDFYRRGDAGGDIRADDL